MSSGIIVVPKKEFYILNFINTKAHNRDVAESWSIPIGWLSTFWCTTMESKAILKNI